MSRRIEFWCDECRAKVPRPPFTWSPSDANARRLLDFCTIECAEKFRQRVIDTGDPRAVAP